MQEIGVATFLRLTTAAAELEASCKKEVYS